MQLVDEPNLVNTVKICEVGEGIARVSGAKRIFFDFKTNRSPAKMELPITLETRVFVCSSRGIQSVRRPTLPVV
jgi:hypothetical protein